MGFQITFAGSTIGDVKQFSAKCCLHRTASHVE
jgi:hypothetical protein